MRLYSVIHLFSVNVLFSRLPLFALMMWLSRVNISTLVQRDKYLKTNLCPVRYHSSLKIRKNVWFSHRLSGRQQLVFFFFFLKASLLNKSVVWLDHAIPWRGERVMALREVKTPRVECYTQCIILHCNPTEARGWSHTGDFSTENRHKSAASMTSRWNNKTVWECRPDRGCRQELRLGQG